MTAGGRAIAAVAFVAVLAPAGCGVKGAPRPAEDTAARAPGDFIARHTTEGVALRWQRPNESVDGEPLYDLAGFEVQRRRPQDRRFETVHRILTSDTDKLRPQKTFRYVDATAGAGVFEYRVRAFLSDGQRGIPTPVVVVDTTGPAAAD